MRGFVSSFGALALLFAPADGGGGAAPPPGGEPPPPPASGSPPPGGGSVADWINTLDEDGRSFAATKGFKSPADVLKGYRELEAYRGRSVAVPADDAKPEELQAFYAKLGRPESPDKYEIGAPEGLPEGFYSKDQEQQFRKIFHDLGFTPRQAKGLMDGYFAVQKAELEKIQADMQRQKSEAEQTLRTEFGQAYPQKIELANRALATFGGDEAVQAVNAAGLGAHPAVVRMLAKIGETIGEAKLREGGDPGRPSAAEAEAEIRKIRAEGQKHPYYDKFHPEHAAAVKRMEDLHRIVAEGR